MRGLTSAIRNGIVSKAGTTTSPALPVIGGPSGKRMQLETSKMRGVVITPTAMLEAGRRTKLVLAIPGGRTKLTRNQKPQLVLSMRRLCRQK